MWRQGLAIILLATTSLLTSCSTGPPQDSSDVYEVDVCVVGGGLTGSGAAIAAARAGASTIVIEKTGYLGGWFRSVGLANVLAVPGWRPYLSEGLLKDITHRVAALQLRTPEELIQSGHIVSHSYENMSQVLLEMAREAGVRIHFFSLLSGVSTQEDRIEEISVQTHVSRYRVRARIFIDCTGLATLAEMAGAPVFREPSNMGLASLMGPVDLEKFEGYLRTRSGETSRHPSYPGVADPEPAANVAYRGAKQNQELSDWFHRMTDFGEKYKWGRRWLREDGPMFGEQYRKAVEQDELKLYRVVLKNGESPHYQTAREALDAGNGVVMIYEGIKVFHNPFLGGVARPRTMIRGVDVADWETINQAHILSQKMLFDYARFLRNHVPGFERTQVIRLADATFNRSGRSIDNDFKPDKEMSESDFQADDAIAKLQRGKDKGVFEVPYRTLLPRKIKNLYAVGKSSSGGTRHRLHSLSVIHGQAAGTAAALCVKNDTLPGELDVKLLQVELRKLGISLPE